MRTRIWFDPPLFRWSRVLGLAAVGVVAIVGWLAHERGVWGGSGEKTAGAAPPAASAAMARSAAAVASGAVRPALVSAGAAMPSASSPAQTPQQALGPRDFEVCGRGVVTVKLGASEEDLEEQALALTAAPMRDRWLAAMLAKADPKTRAAALLLTNTDFSDESRVEQLARLAQASRDPTVYGWALTACHGRNDRSPPGTCLMLTYEQWAALAPGQAIPWLYVAADRAARIDTAEAIFRASGAREMGSTWGVLPAVVLAAEPGGTTPMDRYAMVVEAIAVSAAINARLPYPMQYCGAAALRDANRRQQCEALAQLLASKGDTLLDLTVAKGLGRGLGWPAERLKTLGDEASALQIVSGTHLSGAQPMSCASIERLVEHVGDMGRLGEVGAARALVRRSGKSLKELAAEAEKDLEAARVRMLPDGAASAPAAGP